MKGHGFTGCGKTLVHAGFGKGTSFTGCGKTLILTFVFDLILTFVLKGCGFSRAVSSAKSMPALAAEGSRRPQLAFFRSLFYSCRKSLRSFSPPKARLPSPNSVPVAGLMADDPANLVFTVANKVLLKIEELYAE